MNAGAGQGRIARADQQHKAALGRDGFQTGGHDARAIRTERAIDQPRAPGQALGEGDRIGRAQGIGQGQQGRQAPTTGLWGLCAAVQAA